jgi:hypothetical protein
LSYCTLISRPVDRPKTKSLSARRPPVSSGETGETGELCKWTILGIVELFYNRYITGIVLKLGGQTTKVIDKGSVEYLGPYGLEKGLLNISSNIAKLNTGVITSYALYILIGLIFYLLFNSYINNSIITLALLISLSLVLS